MAKEVDGTLLMEGCAEASTLGLEPGEWPAELTVVYPDSTVKLVKRLRRFGR